MPLVKQLYNLFSLEIPPNRVFGLDLFRTLAVGYVIFWHSLDLMPLHLRAIAQYSYTDVVSGFFVLSGFLIGLILIKTLHKHGASASSLLLFWKRRWWRTLPPYYLILLVQFALQHFVYHRVNGSAPLPFLVFLQNFAYPFPQPMFLESWSLAVEEWFYLLFPLLLVCLIRLGQLSIQKALLLAACVFIVTSTGFRLIRYLDNPVQTAQSYDLLFRKQVITRLDSTCWGVVGAYVAFYFPAAWVRYKRLGLLIGIGLLIAPHLLTPNYQTIQANLYTCVFSFTTITLAALFMLPYLSTWKQTNSRLARPITLVSLLAYSAFLIHGLLLHELVFRIPNAQSGLAFWGVFSLRYVFFWALTLLLSVLFYKYWELPISALRETISRPKRPKPEFVCD